MIGKNYVNGKFYVSESDHSFGNVDPCTEKHLGEFRNTTEEEIDEAYDAARKAFYDWRKISRVQRAEYLYEVAKLIEQRREQLAKIISMETGKNYNESIAEVNEALHMAQYAFGSGRTPQGEAVASEISEKDSYMLRKPKGVVAVISPWNFPLAIGAFWCAAPAIVEGNTVILKPSEDAPWVSQVAMQIYHDAGIPPGVINMVHGDGNVGDYLARKDVDHICFTGSAEVGQHIRRICADSWHKTCSCEMGSKSAVVVFEDANFDLAVSAATGSSFKLSGQRCVSAGRLLVQRNIYDKFVEAFSHFASQIKGGDPFDDEPAYMGPLINEQQFNRVLKYNQMVREDPKASVVIDASHVRPGYFVSPMVYKTEWRDAPYLKEEVFGPHVAIIPFDTVDDAICIYNDTDYGLALGVVTEDFKKARACRDRCDYGMCYWNGGSIAAESHLAFGGVKKSGNGYPSAARTVRAVTHEVSWTVNHAEFLEFPQGMK
jgi:aldehyde dehydrogenase (NAD+)